MQNTSESVYALMIDVFCCMNFSTVVPNKDARYIYVFRLMRYVNATFHLTYIRFYFPYTYSFNIFPSLCLPGFYNFIKLNRNIYNIVTLLDQQ